MSYRFEGKTIGWIRDKARSDAQNVLDAYWSNGVVPIDPVRIAQSLGLRVFSDDLKGDVWGMLVASTDGADIYLDRYQPSSRYRFSCAHEIGHYIDRVEELVDGGAIIDYRSDDSRGRADEVYANEFAGALLMPQQDFIHAVSSGMNEFELSQRFDVSLDAVRYRREILQRIV